MGRLHPLKHLVIRCFFPRLRVSDRGVGAEKINVFSTNTSQMPQQQREGGSFANAPATTGGRELLFSAFSLLVAVVGGKKSIKCGWVPVPHSR